MDDQQLIYQTPSDPEHDAFPDALDAVVANEDCIDLVSPYLSFAILAALTDGRGFHLVTDLHACFEGGVDPRLVEFLSRHAEGIRDLRGVHAKVILGSSSALLGSANLTTYAFERRYEMSCLVEGSALTELQEWFTSLWEHASAVDGSQIKAMASKAKREAPSTCSVPAAGATLPTRTGGLGWLADASSRPRKSNVADIPANDVSEAVFDELAKVLRLRAGSRATARIVMSLFDEALEQIALGVDDDRLHMNFGRRRMSITLGQRYVIWLGRKHGRNTLGLLLDDFDVARKYASTMADVTSSAFRKGGKEDVPSFYWPPEKLDALPDDVKQSWHRGIQDELARCGPSSYVAKKRPSLYSVVRSDRLRVEVVRRAFPRA